MSDTYEPAYQSLNRAARFRDRPRNPETDICRNCRFYHQKWQRFAPSSEEGECRIEPNFVNRITTDWCGQFQPEASTHPEPEPTALAESSTEPKTGSQPKSGLVRIRKKGTGETFTVDEATWTRYKNSPEFLPWSQDWETLEKIR